MLMLADIDDPKLDSTASHPSSSSHSLPRRVVLSSRAPCADDYGWSSSMTLAFSAHASIVYFYCRYPLVGTVGFGFGYGYGRK